MWIISWWKSWVQKKWSLIRKSCSRTTFRMEISSLWIQSNKIKVIKSNLRPYLWSNYSPTSCSLNWYNLIINYLKEQQTDTTWSSTIWKNDKLIQPDHQSKNKQLIHDSKWIPVKKRSHTDSIINITIRTSSRNQDKIQFKCEIRIKGNPNWEIVSN